MEHRYTFSYDREADRRFSKAWSKREFFTRLSHWLNSSIVYGMGTMLLIYVANLIPEEQSMLKYLALPLGLASGGYGLYLVHYYRKAQLDQEAGYADEQWTCVLTDDSFTTYNRQGIGLTVPWREMELAFETDDIWVIKYGLGEMSVDREPLRKAGLEDEFRSRVRVR